MAEMRRQERKAKTYNAKLEKEKREENVLKALKKVDRAASLVERGIALPEDTGLVASHPVKNVASEVAAKAPRLFKDPDFRKALCFFQGLDHVRPIEDWVPHGKSSRTVFRSLAAYLLAKYPMPPYFWNVFFSSEVTKLLPIIVLVSAGESLFELSKKQFLAVPLTKKMCHDFVTQVGDMDPVLALRRVQVKSFGGMPRVADAWFETYAGRSIHDPEEEAFWATVLQWVCQNPMLELRQVGHIIDYIRVNRNVDGHVFAIKGRSPLALLQRVQEWHRDLTQIKVLPKKAEVYPPSGIQAMDFTKNILLPNGSEMQEKWELREILSQKDLLEEGKAMKHCVFSYSSMLTSGRTSIWSLTREFLGDKKRHLTVEVSNLSRSIVQAKGVCNRRPTIPELQVLQAWAKSAGMTTTSSVY